MVLKTNGKRTVEGTGNERVVVLQVCTVGDAKWEYPSQDTRHNTQSQDTVTVPKPTRDARGQ